MIYRSNRGTAPTWRKSSASQSADECVEVAALGPSVLIRDSRDHAAGTLALDYAQWNALLRGIRNGDLERR
ncbi:MULTISPECIES: DUF397 domain-containing protein [Actinomadura]|uniref:DUF397 domain-containing protein n=1 Tax=Actinomadura yumaensis TaxID=111807 RepID=A0ABW2CGE7_9ACTN|nr:DUF397 domain-containing protein [Actinomadura sp. J1-007]MWK34724.1 DUF397 domain-containing protein [Actinomadura sp. J1-007]